MDNFIVKIINYNFFIIEMPNQMILSMHEKYPFGGFQ